jgi:beta-fructofuranosidase
MTEAEAIKKQSTQRRSLLSFLSFLSLFLLLSLAGSLAGADVCPPEALRPKWHAQPPSGVLSDICGTVFYKGRYHLFHQHNAPTQNQTAMQWYHLSSPDLISWQQDGAALLPNRVYNAHGAWDGSVSVVNGTARLLYSCLPLNGTNMLCVAESEDDALSTFKEFAGNPVVRHAPPGSNEFDFRDPTTLFKPPGDTGR